MQYPALSIPRSEPMSRPPIQNEPRQSRPVLPRTVFQAGAYVLIGLLQLLFDTAVFVLLTSAGLAVVPANVIGRATGAALGFALNGKVTFADSARDGSRRAALLRFILLWTVLTLIGSGVLHVVEARLGLQSTWLLKPLVEALMAVFGFLGMKRFVFRPQRPTTK